MLRQESAPQSLKTQWTLWTNWPTELSNWFYKSGISSMEELMLLIFWILNIYVDIRVDSTICIK